MSEALNEAMVNEALKQMGEKPLPPPKPKPPEYLKILTWPDPVLESEAILVPEIDRAEAERLSVKMLETMKAKGGWGLAAPQVGVRARLFVMDVHYRKPYPGMLAAPYIFVNPVIRQFSEELVSLNEGCLSCPGLTERIVRPRHVLVAWHDVHDWSVKVAQFTGWEARVIQHEVDHLNGKCIPDHLPPAVAKKMRKRALAGRRL